MTKLATGKIRNPTKFLSNLWLDGMAHTKIYCTFYAILFYLWQLTYTFIAFKCHWNVIMEEKSSQGYKKTLNTKILQKIISYL